MNSAYLAPTFSEQSLEESLEERAKFRSFFSTEEELQLFLRLPLGGDTNRRDYLNRVIAAHQEIVAANDTSKDEDELKGDQHPDGGK